MKNFKTLFGYIPTGLNILNIISLIVWSAFDCCIATFLSKMTASVLEGNANLLTIALGFALYIIFWEITEYIGDISLSVGETHITNNVYKKTFNKLYTTKPEVLKSSNTGYIAGLLSNITHKHVTAYRSITLQLIIGLFWSIYTIIYFAKFHWAFSIAVLVLTIMALTVRCASFWIAKKYIDDANETSAIRTKMFMDAVTNINTVQKLRSSKFINEKIDKVSEDCVKTQRKSVVVGDIFYCCFKALMFAVCPVCLFVMNFIQNSVEFNKVEFLAYLSLISVKLVHTSKNIGEALKNYVLWIITRKKLDVIIEQQDDKYTLTQIDDFQTMEIKDIEYTYQKDDTYSVTVKIPYFSFNKGDFVCIEGESGQGKTTLLNILSGAISNNNVYIDGQQLDKNINAVYISQDVEMFDMSLRDNLTLGLSISDERLVELIYEVGLKEWYDKQKNGLETILGERGVFVSTGQRQRLNLIRGLLINDKEIYLLDEPTSNVDEKTEEKIINLISKYLKGKTVLIVTHRDKIKSICNKHYEFNNSIISEI